MARFEVRAKPGSRVASVEEAPDGVVTVRVRERAVDGAANDAVVAALAKYFGVRKADVVIVMGRSSRRKVVDVRQREA